MTEIQDVDYAPILPENKYTISIDYDEFKPETYRAVVLTIHGDGQSAMTPFYAVGDHKFFADIVTTYNKERRLRFSSGNVVQDWLEALESVPNRNPMRLSSADNFIVDSNGLYFMSPDGYIVRL